MYKIEELIAQFRDQDVLKQSTRGIEICLKIFLVFLFDKITIPPILKYEKWYGQLPVT